ncbi:MAG: alpha/beta hydrolase-fold protein [Negativicutes bacterium]|nr:alpha/beta hydrolase-fold protein [Negativicutes bacterium]
MTVRLELGEHILRRINHISRQLKTIEEFPAMTAGEVRRIWLHLPAGYQSTGRRYPVLYMADGGNLFTAAGRPAESCWMVDLAMSRLEQEDERLAMLVVGIEHGDGNRLNELLPWRDGDRYCCWLTGCLKPFVDRHFLTMPGRGHTLVAGSSLGGSIALHLVLHYNSIIGNALALSPSYFVLQNGGYWQNLHLTGPTCVYLDCGGYECPELNLCYTIASSCQRFGSWLNRAGAGWIRVIQRFFPDHQHHEWFWQQRFPQAVRALGETMLLMSGRG